MHGFEQSLRYEIIEELGAGAFARVFKAYDRTLKRVVAVKVLNRRLDDEQAQRFNREVEICQRLKHKNIVQMFDANLEAEHPYMVMEYLDGDSLELLLECGAFPIEHAVEIVTQVAWALEHLHKAELLHRDVKPANIVLIDGERAVLTDFNLSLDVEATAISATGQVAGTPRYMAPEIWYGECATPSSDVFSLAIVLYELLTGEEALKRGPSGLPKPLRPLPDSVLQEAPWLADVMCKATNFDQGLRYQKARSFARALERKGVVILGETRSASLIEQPVPPEPKGTNKFLALLLLLPIFMCLGYWFFKEGEHKGAGPTKAQLIHQLGEYEVPPEKICAVLGKLLGSDPAVSVIKTDNEAAKGLYYLVHRFLSSNKMGERGWKLLRLFLRRYEVKALSRPSIPFWNSFVVAALRARKLDECCLLLASYTDSPLISDVTPAAVSLAEFMLENEEKREEVSSKSLTELSRLLEPIVFIKPPPEKIDEALNVYLSVIAYLRNDYSRKQLMRVLRRFCNDKAIPGVDMDKCQWRCAVLLAMAWEPSPGEKDRAVNMVKEAIGRCKSKDWLVEFKCLLACLVTRGLGGAFNPTKEQTAEALAITGPLVKELEAKGNVRNLTIARAIHVVCLEHDFRPEEGAKMLALIKEGDLPEGKKWWYHQAKAWHLANPKTRKRAMKAYLDASRTAPPELKWYFKLLSEGMNASRLLDHFFEK